MRSAFTSPALAIPLALLGGLVACGDDDDAGVQGDTTDADGGQAADLEDVVVVDGDEVTVDAIDNTFRDENIQISSGATVTWENRGRQEHNILPVEGEGWGIDEDEFTPGGVYQHTFDEPGTYRYYCSLHGDTDVGMIGAVVVE